MASKEITITLSDRPEGVTISVNQWSLSDVHSNDQVTWTMLPKSDADESRCVILFGANSPFTRTPGSQDPTWWTAPNQPVYVRTGLVNQDNTREKFKYQVLSRYGSVDPDVIITPP